MGRHCSHMKGMHSYSNVGKGITLLLLPLCPVPLYIVDMLLFVNPVLYVNITVCSTGVQYPIYFVNVNVIGFMFVVH